MYGIKTNYGYFLIPTQKGCYSFDVQHLYTLIYFGTGSFLPY